MINCLLLLFAGLPTQNVTLWTQFKIMEFFYKGTVCLDILSNSKISWNLFRSFKCWYTQQKSHIDFCFVSNISSDVSFNIVLRIKYENES